MRVSDVLTRERKRLSMPAIAQDEVESVEDRLIVAEAMADVMRTVRPVAGRYTIVLNGEQEVSLPYPFLFVENLFLNGAELSQYRVRPQQMSVEE